ncbi:hypothetical protein SRABI26_02246 [Arthrobacter sp. Bi26]|nr:hypothetical protein SRABI26_02246 [Arthrobacter sp. Bi26]
MAARAGVVVAKVGKLRAGTKRGRIAGGTVAAAVGPKPKASRKLLTPCQVFFTFGMSGLFYIDLVARERQMSFEEKSAWIMGVLAAATYTAYLAVVFGLAGTMPLTEVPYVAPLLWTVGASIGLSIVLHLVIRALSAKDAGMKDQRDKEIYRFGEYIGQSFLVVGAVTALLLAVAELDHFWIANVIYLAFVLSAILGSVAKVVAYRKGFQPW